MLDISAIKKIDLFSSLSESSLAQLASHCSTRDLMPGETIFTEGSTDTGLFLLLDGRVEISHHIPNRGSEILAVLETGSYFGEMSLFGEDPSRSATATATASTRLAELNRHEFHQILQAHPELGVELLLLLANRLVERVRTSNDKFAFFAMSNLEP